MSDLISRQEAIEAIERNAYRHTYLDQIINIISNLSPAEVTLCHLDSPCEYQNADIAMPSAQPTAERVGHWVYKKIDEKTGIEYHEFCSECGFPRAQIYGEYCAVCGARMEG